MELIAPRWLHVLMPADQDRGGDEHKEQAKKTSQLFASIAALDERVVASQQNIIDLVGSYDRDRREREKELQSSTVRALKSELQKGRAAAGDGGALGSDAASILRAELRELKARVDGMEERLAGRLESAIASALSRGRSYVAEQSSL